MEYLLDNPDTEKTYQHMLRCITAMQNGVTADSMIARGIVYEKNWGVSIVDLKNFASQYEMDHLLALKLWNKGWRETMILSTMLDEPEKLTEQMMDYRVKSFPNIEIAEQAVMNLFPKTKFAFVKALEWCRGKKYLVKYTGILMMGRMAMVSKDDIDEMFEIFFDILVPLAKDPKLNEVFYRSFCQLGRRSKGLNEQCIEFAEQLLAGDDDNSKKLAQSILDELKSDFVREMFN